MEEKKNTKVAVTQTVGDQVIERVNGLCEVGFILPKDFNHVNAIKGAMLMLKDVKDKSGKPALEVCTQNSISSALFEMCVKGLDVTKTQAYFIVYGNELKLQESYFGTITRGKRASKNYKPIANVIRKGDNFVMGIDPETGLKKIIKHETSLENINNDIVGAYAYVTDNDGLTDIEVMDINQIKTSWSKSRGGGSVAKEFPDQMAIRTVIKRSVKKLINSSPEGSIYDEMDDEKDKDSFTTSKSIEHKKEYVDFEEVDENPKEDIHVDTDTGEIIKEEPTF